MAKIAVEADYAASAAKVWEKLGDFGGIGGWMPGVAKCELEGSGVGATRTLAMGLTMPLSCVAPATSCAQLEAAYAADPNNQTAQCSDFINNSCVCSIGQKPKIADESGTYATTCGFVTLQATNGTPSIAAFCVEGDSLHLMGIDSQGRPTSDQQARRQ